MTLIDTHCHLDAADFTGNLNDVVRHAVECGVGGLVAVGVYPAAFAVQRRALQVARGAGCSAWPAFGTHPWWADSVPPRAAIEALDAAWSSAEPPVAVGEIGLDFARDDVDSDRQNRLFIAQLDWAAARDLPVILHERKSADRLLYWLRRREHAGGVVHGFTGSFQQAGQLIEQGFFIGVGGAITHPGAHRMHRMVKRLPLESLVLETDAPNQPGHAHRGETNRPGYLPENLAAMARLRGLDQAELSEAIAANVERLFKGRLRYNAAVSSTPDRTDHR
ncbi:MAG: TatD family hydrolase [Halothiobacillaceae bacterium]|nr:TatD family hydrolase [Halothiobacillaceae bacterium]HER19479.1 TatD family deoxyribonuclease [Chromatiales bacterium]